MHSPLIIQTDKHLILTVNARQAAREMLPRDTQDFLKRKKITVLPSNTETETNKLNQPFIAEHIVWRGTSH